MNRDTARRLFPETLRHGARALVAMAALTGAAMAQPETLQQTAATMPDPPRVQRAPDAGSYLAARAADRAHDFTAASEWFQRALADDPHNTGLLEDCVAAMIGIGDYDEAQPLATRLSANGAGSQLAYMVLMANAAATNDWAEVRNGLGGEIRVSQLIDGLALAWSFVGEDRATEALDAFDVLIDDPETRQFGLYHKAMAMAVLGDLAGADAIFSGAPDNGLPHTRRSVILHAQILSQMGDAQRAFAELGRFGVDVDPTVLRLRDDLRNGETLEMTVVTSASEGLAEGFYHVARVLNDSAPDDYILNFIRIAQRLNPDDAEFAMMTARLLEKLGRYELAITAFDAVAEGDPARVSAEFGRANVLRQVGDRAGAAAVLADITARHPAMPMAHAELGDTLRAMDRMDAAHAAYSEALALMSGDDPRAWRVWFVRGITAHSLDDWPAAESDLRTALTLNPDEPALLNFLGYSLVERGENLDEALALIERAVARAPENGAIIDSYGWALFRLDRAAEAVGPMEEAAALDPENAVVNDHLGDVYWTVGRTLEARFQWHRALSFETDPDALAAIRAKIEHGLEVRQEAGETGSQDL